MAVPAVLLKAKSAIKKGSKAYKAAGRAKALKDGISDNETGTNPFITVIAIGICAVVAVIVAIFTALGVMYNYPRMFLDNFLGTISNALNGGSSGAINLDSATLESMHATSENASVSGNRPGTDLANTPYGSLEGFNQHIKDTVNSAGYGTRAGVVAAAKALVYDYIEATGKRLRYSMDYRQASDVEGITSEDFYLDCSSFAWWAVYNGGFKMPSYPQTLSQMDWARGKGYLKSSVEGAQPGDFLVSPSHIVLVLGSYDGGYYCAEFSGSTNGAIISTRSSFTGYSLIDMEDYYNDPNNRR